MLNNLITIATLKSAAGKKVFGRGESYCTNGAITQLQVKDDRITAQVQGNELYRVNLWEEGGKLAYNCTCPHANDGYFCKHCVAVGLTWLAGITDFNHTDEPLPTDSWQKIRDYLAIQSPETLIKILLDVAKYDERIYRSFLLKAEPPEVNVNTLKTLRKAIEKATHINSFTSRNGIEDIIADLEKTIDSLEELLTPNGAMTLLELTEYAIERLEKTIEDVNDCDEEGDIFSIDARLGKLHLQASLLAPIDPCVLAERLFQLEMTLLETANSFDPITYSEALGKLGLQRYWELAEMEWRKYAHLPTRTDYDSQYFKIKRIMETLAAASGNTEELVAIHATDLSSAYAYLNIAEIWTEAQQPEKALDWAERGLQAFPEKTDSRLRNFLIDAYLERGRNDEAVQLAWAQFLEQPSLTNYQQLHTVTSTIGHWSEYRERALNCLNEDIMQAATTARAWKPGGKTPNYSRRIEIALWENDLDAAHAAIQQGFCEQSLLIKTADIFASTRPQDALVIYQQMVVTFVDKTKQSAYEEAMVLIKKIATLMLALNQQQPLLEYLNALRVQYKAKRNFIALLDTLMSKKR